MAVNWCFLLNRKNSSPGEAWADICCCKPALCHWPARQCWFLHLRLCERACPYTSWLWFYLILTVCSQWQEDSWHFQLSDGDHILVENVVSETTSWEWCLCRDRVREKSFHLWVPSSICMSCALWFGDRNWLQEEPQGLAVYAHQEAMSKVEATNSSVWWLCYEQGYFVACCMVVPFKMEVLCKILWCVTGTVQLPDRSDQCKGKNQT